MQALTKLNPTDPVRFDGMNEILKEVEARDDELAEQINDCLHSNKNLILEQDIIEYIKSLSTPETFYAGRCTNAPEENSYFVVSVFIGGSDKHIVASQFNAYGACRKWEGDIWNNEFKGWQQTATIEQIGTTKVAMISNSQMYNGWSNQFDEEWARVSIAERNKILQIRVYVVNGADTSSKAFDLPEGFSYVWTENDWLSISGREVYFKKTQIMPSVATFIAS